jgi:hypothetical protein
MKSLVRDGLTRAVNGSATENKNECGNSKTDPKDEFIIHFFPPPVNI